MVECFARTNPEKVPFVKQVIISMGTNDIKYLRKDNGRNNMATPGDMNIFYKPLVNIIKSLRYYFGRNVKICFQSVLPMRAMYTYTCPNFLNFNCLLQSICAEMGCLYLDWFKLFLNDDSSDYNKALFSDWFHLNRAGYSLLHKCLKWAIDCDRYNWLNI